MIDTPRITSTTARQVASLHLNIARDEIRHVMGPAISEVFSVIAAQGATPTGPWFTHHSRRPNDSFDFNVCVPVSAPVMESGRVKPSELPARKKVARTVFSGSYENLGNAWGEFLQWIEANGYTRAPDLWECYTVGPESGSDSANWRTELNQPLED